MTADVSLAKPIPLRGSGPIYIQLTLPGVPWYIYNDHADGYFRDRGTTSSALVLDLAANPKSNDGILLGGTHIPLISASTTTTTTPGENEAGEPTTEKLQQFLSSQAIAQPHKPAPSSAVNSLRALLGLPKDRTSPAPADTSKPVEGASDVQEEGHGTTAEWKELRGARGWHRSPGDLGGFTQNASRRPPSEYYRTVRLEQAQYAVQTTEKGSFELRVKVRSIIGAGVRDTNTAGGRDRVAADGGVFGLLLERDGGGGGGWAVVGVEGVDQIQTYD
ncbi:hypothetical protein N657DRAFT_689939 [Parathielavia appendiculata]|uniref:Uncharacterized protein n=1 Tax=Parathielavia appendiculata TaxID=2587402 RepID=A0AAN6U0W8_9PEZI|nr:hypothetical protein N657DRAFT_689939 [Parathielavia appendiculata]